MKKKIKKKIVLKGLKESGSSEFIKVVAKNLETPIARLHFCAVANPHYFAGSHIPRYKVSIILDENIKEHKEYLKQLEKLAKENDVETLGKRLDDGTVLMTYQGREKPPTFLLEEGKKRAIQIDLEHDLPKDFKCKIKFDLRRYFDRMNKKNAFNFSPNKITFYLDEEMKEFIEVENGDCENSGN